jgi:DNA-binding CsgD family transcriptional regulator
MPIEQILNYCQDPLLIMGVDRKVLWCNAAGRRVLGSPGPLSTHDGRLLLGTASAERELDELLAAPPTQAAQGTHARGQRIERPGATRDWLLLLRPLQPSPAGQSRAFFVHIVGRTRPRALPVQALHEIYGISAREAAVLVSLLRNHSLSESARRLHISRETVRTHLARIFRKCGVHSRDELLTLLHSCAQFGT